MSGLVGFYCNFEQSDWTEILCIDVSIIFYRLAILHFIMLPCTAIKLPLEQASHRSCIICKLNDTTDTEYDYACIINALCSINYIGCLPSSIFSLPLAIKFYDQTNCSGRKLLHKINGGKQLGLHQLER